MNQSKIIGTGLSGLVGSRIVELLPQYQFIDFSLDTQVDLLDRDNLDAQFQLNSDAQIVLHLAAFTDTNGAWLQRGDKNGPCYRLNVIGTQNILDLCQKYKKYLIYISTDFVFGGTKEGSYTEDDPPNPIEWYGQTKYLGEKAILESKYPTAIVRIAFPYRARYPSKKDVVTKTIDKLQQNQICNLFSDQITTPTLVDDIALGLDYFIQNQSPGIFHLVASSFQSVYEMGQNIAQVFALNPKLIQSNLLADYLKTPDARPFAKNLALSNQKVTNLGIKMKTLNQGLQELKLQLSRPL
ncbi:hypothetical protein A3K55_00945 [Candidatus Shapirobacteria bacterium RBG_13_44_7]|uniref:dTDP-4-dehydrorhamnose reductase n=1 Tax=Candidatus Shapirobacteria bacterium RBG_13_44_7 TaxID=1802149 RepID=A0A1F7SJZ0_9BACT|nr:MAG: hypothetical protein A3K55_00945 [Candidatus Shapirobacteria bacterium RBG_13_44_7]